MSIISSAVFRGGSGSAGRPIDEAALIMRRRNRASGDSETNAKKRGRKCDGDRASEDECDDIRRRTSERT